MKCDHMPRLWHATPWWDIQNLQVFGEDAVEVLPSYLLVVCFCFSKIVTAIQIE